MLKKLFGFISLISLFAIGIAAQSSTATLSGRVTDENDAAIVGATVIILNTETGIQRTVITNEDGRFTIPLLQPSRYQLTVSQNNFAPFEVNELALNTNDNRFLNIRLKVGGFSEKVVVEASTVEVNTSPAVATTVDQNMIERIPLNGRTIQNLIALTPGAVTFQPNNATNVGQISVNGLRTTQNYMTIDGVSANLYVGTSLVGVSQSNGNVPGFSQLGTTSNLVSVDALEEFKVQTSNYSAEYGRTPGAQIQLTTRSGKNTFRGSLFEYFRNEKLDANDWFANANRLERSPLRHNNFGGTFSGPLPFLNFGEGGPVWTNGKDRTFFFFAYEGSRVRLPQVANTTVVSRNVRTIAHPSLLPLFSAFPQPTGADNANGLTAPFVAGFSNPQSQDSTSIRIDHNITKQITVFGRYSQSPQESDTLIPASSLAQTRSGDTRTFTVGLNAAFNSNLTSEFRFNWSRNIAVNKTQFRSFQGTTQPDKSLWVLSPLNENSIVSYTFSGGILQQNPNGRGERRQINIANTFSWVKGNHLIKFGGDYRTSPALQDLPDYSFTAQFNSLTAVTTGRAASVSYTINEPRFTEYSWKSFGSFVQDTWRVSKRLTLDYGVRWDVNPPPNLSPDRRLVVVDFVNPIRLAEPGAKLFPTVWNAFAPRIGLAYQLFTTQSWETVVRGGYGLFYDVGSGSAGSVSGAFFPSTATRTATNVQFPFAASVLVPPVISTTPPYAQGNFLVQYDQDFVLPRVHQWNVSIEQGLGKGQTISISYVGNAGRRIIRSAVLGPLSRGVYPVASPDFATTQSFNLNSNAKSRADSSDYNAMQVQFSRNGKNISTIVNYTWSHAIDTSSSQTNISSTNFRVDPRLDRADSAFDRRHAFSTAVTWNIPSVSKQMNSILNAITRDWSLDGIFQFQTGYPIDIIYLDNTVTNNLSLSTLRPDSVPGVPLWIPSTGPTGRQINPAAFSIPATTRQGNLPRSAIRVQSLWQPDISLSRTFGFGEKVKLKFKAEVFNFVNHPMFAAPNNALGVRLTPGAFTPSATFGQFTTMLNRTTSQEGIALSSIYAPGGPRSVQLSIKLSF